MADDPTRNEDRSDRDPLDLELRRLLQRDPAPEALRQRLLAEARARKGGIRRLNPLMWTLTAASLLGLVFWISQGPDLERSLARQALADAETTGLKEASWTLTHEGGGCGCSDWSRRELGFEAPLPQCLAGCEVQGGRACQLGDRPAAAYRLAGGRTLYVFSQPFGGRRPERFVTLEQKRRARLWDEGGRGYLLLEPN